MINGKIVPYFVFTALPNWLHLFNFWEARKLNANFHPGKIGTLTNSRSCVRWIKSLFMYAYRLTGQFLVHEKKNHMLEDVSSSSGRFHPCFELKRLSCSTEAHSETTQLLRGRTYENYTIFCSKETRSGCGIVFLRD